MLAHLFLAVVVVFGVNLMPAFGSPTWAVLVFFRFRYPEVPASGLIAGIAVLIAVVFIDWPTVIDKARGWWAARRGRPAPPSIHQSARGQLPRAGPPPSRSSHS